MRPLLAALLPVWLALALAGAAAARVAAEDSRPVRGLAAVARPLEPAELAGEKLDAAGSAGLFVGVGLFDAQSGLVDLRYTPDDAVAMAHLFSLELKLIPPARVHVALGGVPRSQRGRTLLAELQAAGARVGDARRLSLLDALDETVRNASAPDGLLVVTFGSHGFEEKGTAYIMPSDGRRKYVGSTGVSVQTVKDTLREAKANKRILVLDACRETLGSDVRGEGKMNAALRDALKASEGFAIVASCGAGQLSWESPELEQGVFTHFLLEAIRGGAGADSPDGFIRLGDASAHAALATRDWVRAQKHEEQEPWFEGELARSIPLAVHPAALERRATAAAAASKLDERRQSARRLLALAVAEDAENQFAADTLVSVRGTLDRLSGKDLGELLGELEALADNTPRNRRIFAQYWKDRRAALGAPAAIRIATVPRVAAPVLAAMPATNRATAILDSLAIPETPKPTNARFHLGDLVLHVGNTNLPRATAAAPWTNDFGMPFVPVPGTKILMCTRETRRSDFAVYALVNPTASTVWKAPTLSIYGRLPTGGDIPVVGVNWDDAHDFCDWLTLRGRLNGTLKPNQAYRLPTDAEWSRAVGLEAETGATPAERAERAARVYPWGTNFPPPEASGNYRDVTSPAPKFNVRSSPKTDLVDYRDGYPTLAPTGSFPANSLGLRDLGGNVAEMCDDLYKPGKPERVARGGAWVDGDESSLRSGARRAVDPTSRGPVIGFRLVLYAVEPKAE